MLTWRDIRVRYKQTAMGLLWALLMPAMVVVAGILVKKAFSVSRGGPFSALEVASVSVKALPWAFVVGSIRFATSSLSGNPTLLTKIYFPREVLPLSAVLANLFDFAIASLVLVLVLAVIGITPSVQLWWLPILLTLLIMLTAAAALLLACANLFFRDVKYLVEIALTFGIFFIPVLYDARTIGNWGPLLLLNPLGALLEAMNDIVILRVSPNPFWLAYAAAWAVASFITAAIIFHSVESEFAERV
jgi:lipopolysaccharide transport system permease protein